MSLLIEKVLDINKWETLQEKLAIATHLAIVLVDYRGIPISHHSRVRPFCQKARQDPRMRKYCEKCDALAALEAVRTRQPYIYRCHFDIVDIAIPIMVDDNYVGAIMAGEIRLDENHDMLDQVLVPNEQQLLDEFKERYADLYQDYQKISIEQLGDYANMLAELSEYIVSEAAVKEYYVQRYQQTIQLIPQLKEDAVAPSNHGMVQNNENSIKPNIHCALKNTVLQPVIDAIFDHPNIYYSLDEMAQIANLNANYLSRLFKEEFDQSFTQFYKQQKILWAKEALLANQLSVKEVGESLGFTEPSYFSRVFKEATGLTPLKYKRIHLQ